MPIQVFVSVLSGCGSDSDLCSGEFKMGGVRGTHVLFVMARSNYGKSWNSCALCSRLYKVFGAPKRFISRISYSHGGVELVLFSNSCCSSVLELVLFKNHRIL